MNLLSDPTWKVQRRLPVESESPATSTSPPAPCLRAVGSVMLLCTDSETIDLPMQVEEVLTHSLLELHATCA